MREILFRGQTGFERKWIEGYYSKEPSDDGFIDVIVRDTGEWNEIYPETLGQFTGVYANGVKIFEGDIVHCTWYDDTSFNGVVVFEDGKFLLESDDDYVDVDLYFKEVIGNIHDKEVKE